MSNPRRPAFHGQPGRSPESESWPPVFLLDPDVDRRSRVAEALKQCAGDLRVLDPDKPLPSAAQTESAVAVVALDRSDEDLRFVTSFRHRRCDVIVYGAEWSAAAIGRRCQVLLAGAACLLDSTDADFERQVRARVVSLLRTRRQARAEQHELSALMGTLGIIGRSPVMHALFRWIVRVSTLSDVPVLIHGESGTGKELVARAIHQLDTKRGRGPFVPLNCNALSPGLAESELFGHKRGAFTGAAGDRPGLLRSADHGVLFLDEIGDLDIGLQGKLLRALQESRVLGVGEDREVAVSVRVIAASNRDLQKMVDEGRFRLDLYHRLSVLVTRLPGLAERREDIEPLIDHFLHKHGSLRPADVPVGADFVAALAGMDLPGNVRQLENLVWRALVHRGDEGALDLEDLPPEVWEQLGGRDSGPSASSPLEEQGSYAAWTAILDAHRWSLSQSLQACEKALLHAALQRSHGNQSKTARLLGVTPRSIYNKVRRHQLDS